MPEISEPHATSHESGGEDEVEFLKLTDRKHKTKHQDGGDDEISVAGLSGTLADAQTPSAHASSHESGGADEVEYLKLTDRKHAAKHEDGGDDAIDASKLDKMLKIVPYNGKLADINEADTNKHTLDLAAALGETRKIISVTLDYSRVSGSGALYAYPNEGSWRLWIGWNSLGCTVIIKDGTQRLQYDQSVANDKFEVWCLGYVVEA